MKDVSMGDVHTAVREIWLARFAMDAARMDAARTTLEEIEVDDEGRLVNDFLVWPAGEAVVDVENWFRSDNA